MIVDIRATDAFRQAMAVPVSKLPALRESSSPGPGVFEVHDQYVGESCLDQHFSLLIRTTQIKMMNGDEFKVCEEERKKNNP
jgi:hypothetical protein